VTLVAGPWIASAAERKPGAVTKLIGAPGTPLLGNVTKLLEKRGVGVLHFRNTLENIVG
jgi:hypothetical protein